MRRIFLAALMYGLAAFAVLPQAAAQEQETGISAQGERIVTEAEVQRAEHPPASVPLRFVFYPFHVINSGMESGLISFEKHNMRERLNYWTEYLRQRGVAVLIGGLGEGTGIGLGGSYTLKTGGKSDLRFLGRASFMRGYEEFDVRWTNPVGKKPSSCSKAPISGVPGRTSTALAWTPCCLTIPSSLSARPGPAPGVRWLRIDDCVSVLNTSLPGSIQRTARILSTDPLGLSFPGCLDSEKTCTCRAPVSTPMPTV